MSTLISTMHNWIRNLEFTFCFCLSFFEENQHFIAQPAPPHFFKRSYAYVTEDIKEARDFNFSTYKATGSSIKNKVDKDVCHKNLPALQQI